MLPVVTLVYICCTNVHMGVYSYDPGLKHGRCVAGGSGSAYIYGLCDKQWKAGMSEDECKAFVQKAVGHAMARDGSSGGCIRTVSISKTGVKQDFVPGSHIPPHFGELKQPVQQPGLVNA